MKAGLLEEVATVPAALDKLVAFLRARIGSVTDGHWSSRGARRARL